MERASIDELFIDVTAFCYQSTPRHKSGKSEDEHDDDHVVENNSICANEKVAQVDNTKHAKFRSDCDADNATNQLPKETVVCHPESVDFHETNSEIGKALRRGCYVALTARNAVMNTLGFTLSAGISTSKLVAKLAATYGKPNGQVSEAFCCMLCIACILSSLSNLLQKWHIVYDIGSGFSKCNAKCNGGDAAS